MVVADLHCHTTNSDGTLTLGTLPAAAAAAGLEAVAVTDHDRLHPGLDAPVVELGGGSAGGGDADGGKDEGAARGGEDGAAVEAGDEEGAAAGGVTLVHGIELRVEPDGAARVDLLGYGARRTDALADLVAWVQEARVERGRAMVETVEDHLGVDLRVAVGEGFGRPHVARAVAGHPDVDLDYEGAFDELIAEGRPCYVRRPVPSFERGRRVLAEACGVVGLAHPLRYDDPAAALSLCADLDAAELYYPYEEPADATAVERAVREHDLLATGGSDAHDERLGLAGLDSAAYERFRAALA